MASVQMSRGSNFDVNVRERSGWIIPIAVFLVTALLCALFLLYYLAPNPASFIEERPLPTPRSDPVRLQVDGLALVIPSNYLPFVQERRGGPRREVALFAEFPDFQGYSDRESQVFSENNPDSPVIYMLIREEAFDISEAAKLKRVYLNQVVDARGTDGPFGLVQYAFRDDSGYRGEDLFVGQSDKGILAMRCVKLTRDVPSPSCLRDVRLARGVALTYRFKRLGLTRWREIARGVDRLVTSFRAARS
jgi:hypothetical protein